MFFFISTKPYGLHYNLQNVFIYSRINLLPLASSVSGLVSATWTSLGTVAAVITSGGSVTLLQATGSVYTCQVSRDWWRAGHVTTCPPLIGPCSRCAPGPGTATCSARRARRGPGQGADTCTACSTCRHTCTQRHVHSVQIYTCITRELPTCRVPSVAGGLPWPGSWARASSGPSASPRPPPPTPAEEGRT